MRTKLFLMMSIMFLLGGRIYAQMGTPRLIITDGLDKPDVKAQIERNTSLLLTAMAAAQMEERNPDLSRINITAEASKSLLAMWETSDMVCPVLRVEGKCLQRPQSGGYQVRDIPITMIDAPEDEQNQYLVINFTKEGKIDDIFIAVHGIMEVLNNSATVSDYVRKQRILELVERFRTAYNERDISYLQTIFSNNAVIITGKVIKEIPNSDQMIKGNLTTERIEYVVQTKEQYLKKLKIVFNIVKYINITFDDIKISTHPKYPDIYGVSLKQKWVASNYSDEGFLFLLIDFKNEDEPVIHVRAWQPTVFNGRELKPEEKFHTASFGEITGR